MIYIPNQWLENKENLDAVHKILNSELYSELNVSERVDVAIRRLRNIGEKGIAEKLKNGEIVLPS